MNFMQNMKYLNCGCGNRFHPAWVNIDFIKSGDGVLCHDLTKGIPFPDESFNVVYHSHLLEHFDKETGRSFLKECRRLLCHGGILRIATPDLEQIARLYLESMEKAAAGSREWAANYEWMILEMFDQTMRDVPGGEMAIYLQKEHIANEEFILKRCGIEAKNIIEAARDKKKARGSKCYNAKNRLKEALIKLILRKEYNLLQIGRFRQSGEVHGCMYDQYSLLVLLKECGFEKIARQGATESNIQNWASFNLDTEPDGAVYKPDSFYVEAIRP